MKRAVPLLTVICLFLACMIVPARADEVTNEEMWIEALDYGFFHETAGTNTYYLGSDGKGYDDISITLRDSREVVYYIDVLFLANGSDLYMALECYGREYPMTIVSCGESFYRAYIRVGGYGMSEMELAFSGTGNTYLTIYSCKYTIQGSLRDDINCACDISASGFYDTINYVPTDTVNYRNFTGTSSYELSDLTLVTHFPDWKKYDYIDLLLFVKCGGLTSVSATFGSQVIPIETNLISNSNYIVESFFITARIDLRGLDKTSTNQPMIRVTGRVSLNEDNFVGVSGCAGYICANNVDPTLWYMDQQLNAIQNGFNSMASNLDMNFSGLISTNQSGFQSILDALSPESGQLEQFQDTVDSQSASLGDIGASMESVTKPDFGIIDAYGQFIGALALDSGAGVKSAVTVLFNNDILNSIFLVGSIISLLGFVLYGKR